MKTLRLEITRGVALPGGIDALPGESHEVEERFARALLFEGRAIPATDILAGPTIPEVQEDGPETSQPEPPLASQDRDPLPINRDPSRRPRRTGPRR